MRVINLRISIFIGMTLLISLTSLASTTRDYKKECQQVSKYSVQGDFPVECRKDYHHFNSITHKYSSSLKHDLKISEFNALHPGMEKTRFKDFKRIASLINKWDIIGMTELLPLNGSDLTQNTSLIKFIEVTAPQKIQLYQQTLRDAQKKLSKTTSARRTKALNKKIEIAKKMLSFYKAEITKAKKHYRTPGYLKILNELHKLKNGKHWALLLSPKGEASKPTHTQELIGYFYRSDLVKPVNNNYCRETQKKTKSYACMALMNGKLIGSNKSDIFSRRPFIASFKAKKFTFTLLTSHVVYTSPDNLSDVRRILQKSFGVNHWKNLSTGINKDNYARFAEVKVTLDFITKLRNRYAQKDIIYMGDLNLNFKNKFWTTVLKSTRGFELYVDQITSLSKTRYHSDGSETNGLSNDFDHFLFDPSYTNECLNSQGQAAVSVENFYKGAIGRYVRRIYEVRTSRISSTQYSYNKQKYQKLMDKFVAPYRSGDKTIKKIGYKKLNILGKPHSVRGLITDTKEINLYADFFQKRILDSQLADKTYYKFFTDILSDHMPIVLNCKI